MATQTWQQKKQTFNPNKNYFDCINVEVSREISKEEARLSKLSVRYFNWGLVLCTAFTCGALFGGVALGYLELWSAFAIVMLLCIAGIIFSSWYLMKKSSDFENELDRYLKDHDVWNTPEVQEIKRYNEEQERIAEAWRAEHPFEEHIRVCLKDPNSSVAIAEAAKYYAENYLNKEN
jgi:hypothetical protein